MVLKHIRATKAADWRPFLLLFLEPSRFVTFEAIALANAQRSTDHHGSPNPSSARIWPFAGLTEWSC